MLGLYGAEHSKFNRMMTLGFEGLHVLKQNELLHNPPMQGVLCEDFS